MDLTGTVTLNLKDYHNLIEEHPKAENLRKNLYAASKEIEVFLSFLCTREAIEDYVEEFNKQSKSSVIAIENVRAIIKKKNDITI